MAEREVEITSGAPGGDWPGSCDVSDACDALQVEAFRTGALRPLWPGCAPVCGRLTTVRLEPAQGAPAPLPELLDLLAEATGALVLVDLGGRTDVQCWGAVLATAARHYGLRGALVNGAARDVAGLRELGFPTYARGVFPGAMRGRLRLAAIDEPVPLDGALVEPTSFAVVDASGAVFLPAARAEHVLAASAERQAREREQLRAIAAGAEPHAVFLAEPNAAAGEPPR